MLAEALLGTKRKNNRVIYFLAYGVEKLNN
jgi:hypothetical protein